MSRSALEECCSGWSIGVYHTDLDQARKAARDIVRFAAEVRLDRAARFIQ